MKKKISMNNFNENKSLDEAFKDFIQYSRAKNLSDRTIAYYQDCYSRFKSFIEDRGNSISCINKEHIQLFVAHLQANLSNRKTINSVLRGVRTFLYYCMRRNYLIQFHIELIKTRNNIKETYTDQELKILLEKPDLNNSSFPEYRTWVIIKYLLATGNKVGTIVNLKIGNLDFNNGYIYVNLGKKEDRQIIPLGKSLLKILEEYLHYRKGDSADYLFPTRNNTQLSRGGLRKSIKRYNEKRGVIKTGVHLFRHTFAKLWIRNGGDLFRLQKILGHSDMDLVKKYKEIFSDGGEGNQEWTSPNNNVVELEKFID